ncbi:uncharacterized protein VP01_3248g1 [Puccinia sorghi]|uniref:Lysophospholipase n=1 Tax=Puccinia sorghi TaxID=27349 RepID=A0A0L6UXY8_9BASI|nr:uncharacterized protein VP01_3248g1 [Puccinia sorghi]
MGARGVAYRWRDLVKLITIRHPPNNTYSKQRLLRRRLRASSTQKISTMSTVGLIRVDLLSSSEEELWSDVSLKIPTHCGTSFPVSAGVARASNAAARNQTMSEPEKLYRRGRQAVLDPLWRDFFTNGPGKATGYQSSPLMTENHHDWPVFGIAHSGGGLRASLYAAGVMQALDSRSSSPLRAVYPLASYVTGLSGGSWSVVSAAANNYPAPSELVSGWELEKDLVLPGGLSVQSGLFLNSLHETAQLKRSAGYDISITDLWGRAIGYHFLPGTNPQTHGAGMLMSGLRSTKSMQSFQVPIPIIVSNHKPADATARNPKNVPISGSTYVPLSAPVYEYSPFEFGSFDPQLSAFIPSEFLGTSLISGQPFIPTPSSKRARTSSQNRCLFNAVTALPGKYQVLTARYPNPFQGVNGAVAFDRSSEQELVIVDGGENGENIPLNPLLAPARQVDVILAADAGVNGPGWPNGSSMINTFLRATHILPAGTASFPRVPLDPKIWEQQGLTSRPVFFGCETPQNQPHPAYPLVIYLPNSPTNSPSLTNHSTFKLEYSKKETSSFLNSVLESTTRPRVPFNKGDADWPTCFSCALVDRARSRRSVARSAACENCFKRFCFS